MLATKLYVPQPQPTAVVRPRLIERLNEGLHRKLTLISAPAGFGKTTVVSEWVACCDRPVAWLSLDEGDSDPTRFLAYLVAALQTIAADIGQTVLGALQSPQPPPIASTLTSLLNEITTVPDDIMLVLDDYHAIDAKSVDDALTFLIEHLPPNMHIAITTREDPRLPLARMRVRGQLTELRAADLRFTPTEAAEFLNQMMGLDLSEGDIAALESRTEGWIAGLQLAAISMRGHDDAAGFIASFTGSHRFVLDYLVEEVLQRQPAPVRSFLLQTSILDRLTGPLCDTVTGQEGGQLRLESLERGNFLVVPLDDQRRWYRYHHLFADVLRAHLQAEQPEQVATLHQGASEWYEHHGSIGDAIRHAMAAGDVERAANLVERALPAYRRDRLSTTLLGWLKALPDEVIRWRPVLCVAYATVLMSNGELDDVEDWLRDAERWLDATADTAKSPPVGMVVIFDEEFRRLPGLIAAYRAGHAYLLGDIPATTTHAQQALDLVPADDHVTRGAAAALLGLAFWASGDLEAAQQHYATGMASLGQAGFHSDVINGANTVAAIKMAQGRIRDAERTLEQAIQRATELGNPNLHGTSDFLVGLSEIKRERNDLDAATDHLRRAQELAPGAEVSHNRARWCVAMARIKEARGDLDGALVLLDEAERLRGPDFFPRVRPVAAVRTRIWLKQGRLDDARDWARERGLSAKDDLSYLREFEHITLARLLLAEQARTHPRGSLHEVMALLDRLLHQAETGGSTKSAVEILLLQALAHQLAGDIPAALVPLKRALTLAEPEGYVRVFVDEGPPLATLLDAASKQGAAPSYTRQLLTDSGTPENRPPTQQDLIEPLSDRELDVLRLLATDLDGPEIARELNVTLNTMRTHTKNIYSKLGVTNRRAAISRADELGLSSRTRRL
jgi:LuxR family maltose regulon positive regulatory protein